MRDVVFLMFVETDTPHEVDLDFVSYDNSTEQFSPGAAGLLRDGKQGGNVIAGMRVIRSEKRVVHVEFANGYAVSPGGPFTFKALVTREAKESCPILARVCQSLGAGVGNRFAIDGGNGDRGIVDHAVYDHLRDFRKNGCSV